MSALISQVRSGELDAAPGLPLSAIAEHRDDNDLLPARVAGIELLNLLRPTIAVVWLVAFTALTPHENPLLCEQLRGTDDAVLESFAHELRQLCPFVPLLGARARVDFEWQGVPVPENTRVVLDVYGTLHDPRLSGSGRRPSN